MPSSISRPAAAITAPTPPGATTAAEPHASPTGTPVVANLGSAGSMIPASAADPLLVSIAAAAAVVAVVVGFFVIRRGRR
jgi:hypothetical protein